MIEQVHANLVSAAAEHAGNRVADAVVVLLQGQPAMLSGDDSGLGSVWLEFCVQVQGEHSYDWDAFELHVRQMVEGLVAKLAPFERDALWLQTPSGEDWLDEPDMDLARMPVDTDAVVDKLYRLVWRRAADWEDDRIGRFLYPGDDSDDFDDDDEDEVDQDGNLAT